MIYKNPLSSSPVNRSFRTNADRPLALLKQCPVYEPTPLFNQTDLAERLKISSLFIKDESKRMRLGSFKALGGAFAVAQIISDTAGTDDFLSDKIKDVAANMTFSTASAGNHGLSVAAGAKLFGAQAVIFLASAVSEEFADRIRSLNAEVIRIEGSYEDSVSESKSVSESRNWLLLSDGSWPGYTERPALIMEGYSVLAEECRRAFVKNQQWPDHIYLQAGVGGLAASFAAHVRVYWEKQPIITVVEPEAASCLLQSVRAGRMSTGEGPLSNMGRLDCKEASLIAYEALRADADYFTTVTDPEAEEAVRKLGDAGIQTTPSGAASFAAICNAKLTTDSRSLILVTEGQTEER
ncbi:MAG: diaminopropionate ammonia-lyase [Sneathiella sp.]